MKVAYKFWVVSMYVPS